MACSKMRLHISFPFLGSSLLQRTCLFYFYGFSPRLTFEFELLCSVIVDSKCILLVCFLSFRDCFDIIIYTGIHLRIVSTLQYLSCHFVTPTARDPSDELLFCSSSRLVFRIMFSLQFSVFLHILDHFES